MNNIDYLVVVHCTVDGKNGELLGSDESHITYINCQFIDTALNRVVCNNNFAIQRNIDEVCKAIDNGVDKNVSFEQAIEQIDSEINEFLENGSKKLCFAVDGMLQFRQCLFPQAVRNGIKLKSHYHQFYDVRKEYRNWSGNKTLVSLEDMAKDSSIQLPKVTSNIPRACQLCSELIMKLLKNGHTFQSPKIIMEQLEPGLSSGFVKNETIIKVRGLPWQVSDHDVATFFAGLNILRGGVALCLNSKGRRNGEAFVRFENDEQRNFAIKRHKHHLSGRYIEVYKGSAQEFLKIARGPSGAMNATSSFLSKGGKVLIRMRGLPYSASAKDVLEFFGCDTPIHNDENGVMFVHYPDGTATGDAFAIFNTEEDGANAVKKHREKIGTRYVELFRSTQAELQQVLTMYNVGYQFISPVGMVSPLMPPLMAMTGAVPSTTMETNAANERVNVLMSMSCLRLRGLPFSASKDDVIKFLLKYSSGMIGTVHIIFNLQGRPSGECLLQMKSVEIAQKAANDLHLKHIGERYIEVFQCSIHDMSLMLATSHANQMSAYNNNNNNNNNSFNNNTTCLPPSPAHAQHSHRLLAPSTAFIHHPVVPTIPAMYNNNNNNYQHISSSVNPVHFFPPLPVPFIAPFVPADSLNYPLKNAVTRVAYTVPTENHRAIIEKNRQIDVHHRSAELFSV